MTENSDAQRNLSQKKRSTNARIDIGMNVILDILVTQGVTLYAC